MVVGSHWQFGITRSQLGVYVCRLDWIKIITVQVQVAGLDEYQDGSSQSRWCTLWLCEIDVPWCAMYGSCDFPSYSSEIGRRSIWQSKFQSSNSSGQPRLRQMNCRENLGKKVANIWTIWHTHTFHLIWSHLVWSHLLSYHIICSTCFCWVMFWDCAFQAANCVSGNNPYFLQGFAMTRLPCWIITSVPAGSMLTSPGVYTVFYLWIYIQCYTHTYIYNMNIFTLYI